MTDVSLFPFADYWWFYGAFTLFVLGMLALDLGVFHRRAHEVSPREALTWRVVWTSLALGFAAVLYIYCLRNFPMDPGKQKAELQKGKSTATNVGRTG